tara:strand:+ start:1738 stop:3036 length:1299 start_codon:yes stop_codon:yes gene_type:complete
MKKQTFLLFVILVIALQSFSQCFAPSILSSSNTNYYNAQVNWNTIPASSHYKIRYKEIGTNTWLYKNNIAATLNLKIISNLIPLSNYIWQIRSHCDTINSNTSNWSVTDTFITTTNSCPNITTFYTDNINYNNATANWDTITQADRYKVHYRELGTTNWQNLGFIYNPIGTALIPVLEQSTTYEWQIMVFYDATNLLTSLWSASDTFTTTSFIPATFNPILSNTIDIPICNTASSLTLTLSQAENEPDIGALTITSDGGNFNIQSLSIGDSVGNSTMTTASLVIESALKVGYILGQNLAIINSYDSTGNLIGAFTIENINGGITVSSISPNDGNNYTAGFTSEINFTSLFITPNINGPLHFYTDIQSELNDQFNNTDTIMISCLSSLSEVSYRKDKNYEIYDLLGKPTIWKKNTLLIYKYLDGKTKKIITKY